MIEPKSEELTVAILESLELENVIYAEIAELGAMGNRGGVLIYYKEVNNNIIRCFESNHFKDEDCYSQAEGLFKKYIQYFKFEMNNEINPFTNFYGGFGNHCFINKNANLQLSEDFFIYTLGNEEYIIYSSVAGVFLHVVEEMKKNET